MQMRSAIALCGAAGMALAGAMLADRPASAHHSMAMFDQTREVTVSGTVREFQWTNPHAYIQMVSKNRAGEDVEWSLEMGAPMYLYARGWRPRTLRPGTEIKARIYPLRNGLAGGVVLDVTDAAGKSIGSNQ